MNPTLTRDLYEKPLIDLTEDDMLLEAHEMASYAYDMVNEILEVKL